MITPLSECRRRLENTSLGGKEFVELPILKTDDQALAIRTCSKDSLSDWKTAHSLSPETGRWPCVVAADSHGKSFSAAMHDADFFSRFFFRSEYRKGDRSGDDPRDVIDAASRLDLNKELNQIQNDHDEPVDEWIDFSCEETEKEFGRAPDTSEVRKAIEAENLAGYFDLEKWFFEWEIKHFGPKATEVDVRYLSHIKWYDPTPDEMAILLLPTANCWEVPAFVHWYAGESWNSQVIVALLEHWHERYGADFVAHFGTMIHLLPARLPTTPQEAFELALEQHLIAPCTTTLPCISLRDHARAMLRAKKWFLHERP